MRLRHPRPRTICRCQSPQQSSSGSRSSRLRQQQRGARYRSRRSGEGGRRTAWSWRPAAEAGAPAVNVRNPAPVITRAQWGRRGLQGAAAVSSAVTGLARVARGWRGYLAGSVLQAKDLGLCHEAAAPLRLGRRRSGHGAARRCRGAAADLEREGAHLRAAAEGRQWGDSCSGHLPHPRPFKPAVRAPRDHSLSVRERLEAPG
jgi:hypothetical protein